jgi:hypothetical protein
VNQYRFINRSQPQTLFTATLLCYWRGFFGLLGGIPATSQLISVLLAVGLGLGGFGIANDKRWGYGVAVGAAIIQIIMLVYVANQYGVSLLDFNVLITLLIDGALAALLLHPMSRNYQRIWFH